MKNEDCLNLIFRGNKIRHAFAPKGPLNLVHSLKQNNFTALEGSQFISSDPIPPTVLLVGQNW